MGKHVLEFAKNLTERFADVEHAAKSGEAYRKVFTFEPNEKIVNDENRTVTFTITTGSVDRDNDVITPGGWEIADYLKNPVVLWAHDYSKLPVARAESIEQTANGLKSTAKFPPKGLDEFADKVFEFIKLGILNASSVGFKPKEYSRDEERGGINFLQQSMLEWSIVPVPANAEALALASAKGIDVSPIMKWAEATIEKFGKPTLAKKVCSDCQSQYEGDGNVCSNCASPKSAKRTESLKKSIVSTIIEGYQKSVQNGQIVTLQDGDDPVRWNRTLSKGFDVEGEPIEASKLEIALVSRFLDTKVQYLSMSSFEVPAARMGSFLAATEERLAEWKIEATRNVTDTGRETPPTFETIQLNSTNVRTFLVEGIRFMRRDDGVKMCLKFRQTWCGLVVTCYVPQEKSVVVSKFVDSVWSRAAELNYLRGEAFTLGGEFLERGNLSWEACFFEQKTEKVLRKTVDRINEQGEDMESRGLMLMGPPGTGKTLSGRVMLRQADTTFIWVSARDFFRAGAFGAFTYAFDLAAECAPSIIFFEDVDNWLYGSYVDLLKTEMDGLKSRKGIQTILTTNFPELIPDALIDRPGRFHDVLELGLPVEDVRLRMLAAWMPSASDADRIAVARDTDGFSGAHIYELAKFAKTIEGDEKLPAGEALKQALAKIKEQRELIASLKNGGSDYRPSRVIRTLVAESMDRVTKRGRVLSASNEGKIRIAADSIVEAGEKLQDVLSQLKNEPEAIEPAATEDETAKGIVLRMLPAETPAPEAVVLRLSQESGDETLSPEQVTDAIKQAVTETLAAAVKETVASALNRARGRVD